MKKHLYITIGWGVSMVIITLRILNSNHRLLWAILLFVATFVILYLNLLQIKKVFLNKLKELDPVGYRKAIPTSGFARPEAVRFDKTYNYSLEILDLYKQLRACCIGSQVLLVLSIIMAAVAG